jgi:hypothetical protein
VNIETLMIPAVILVFLASVVLLVSWDWRASIFALAVQYAGVFVLVAGSWPIPMAVVKLVAGWMAGAVLGMALVGSPEGYRLEQRPGLAGISFRLLVTILFGLIGISLAPKIADWVPGIAIEQVYGGLALLGLGLLHLGLAAQPLRVTLGLLTTLAGFEIFYAVVESSTMVSGLLASVSLGLALVGAYLLVGPSVEAAE